MSRAEFESLTDSIQKNGQHEPILLFDGSVLDGWHRYQACESVGIEPITEPFTGSLADAKRLVLIKHNRRSLPPGQYAACALATMEWAPPGRPKELTNVSKLTSAQAAKETGVSKATIDLMRRAVKQDENAIDKIAKGETTASAIVKQASPAKPKPIEPPALDKYQSLLDEYNELILVKDELLDDLSAYRATEKGESHEKIKLLEAQLRISNQSRDAAIREKTEMLKDLQSWKRRAERAEAKLKNTEVSF